MPNSPNLHDAGSSRYEPTAPVSPPPSYPPSRSDSFPSHSLSDQSPHPPPSLNPTIAPRILLQQLPPSSAIHLATDLLQQPARRLMYCASTANPNPSHLPLPHDHDPPSRHRHPPDVVLLPPPGPSSFPPHPNTASPHPLPSTPLIRPSSFPSPSSLDIVAPPDVIPSSTIITPPLTTAASTLRCHPGTTMTPPPIPL